jgi:hypothetical protein
MSLKSIKYDRVYTKKRSRHFPLKMSINCKALCLKNSANLRSYYFCLFVKSLVWSTLPKFLVFVGFRFYSCYALCFGFVSFGMLLCLLFCWRQWVSFWDVWIMRRLDILLEIADADRGGMYEPHRMSDLYCHFVSENNLQKHVYYLIFW